jgi:senataxin
VKEGVYDITLGRKKPNVVRIGVLDKNPSDLIKQTSLDFLAEKEWNSQAAGKTDKKTAVDLKIEIEKLDVRIEKMKKDPLTDQKQLHAAYEKKRNLLSHLADARTDKRIEKEKFSEIMYRILANAEIICCTLSSAGSDKLESIKNSIDTVIIDEAAQAVEPTTLIPLQYSPKRVILIGDPKQLPATTFDPNSNKTLYNRSFFEVCTTAWL